MSGESNNTQNNELEISKVALMGRTLYILIAANPSTDDINNVIFLAEKAINEKTASNIMVDLSLSEGFSKFARKIWSEFIQNEGIHKAVFFGGDIYTETTVSFIVGAAGSNNCKLVSTREEADKWMKEGA